MSQARTSSRDHRLTYWGFVAITLVLLLLAMATSATSLNSAIESNRWVVHTHEVLNKLQEINASVEELRALAQARLPQDYEVKRQKLTHLIDLTRGQVADNPMQLARLNELERRLVPELQAQELILSGSSPPAPDVSRVNQTLMTLREAEDQLLFARNQRAALDTRARVRALWMFSITVLVVFPLGQWALARALRERRQAQRALSESEARHRDLYNLAPCGYHSLDPQGCYQEVNQTELDWTGYTPPQLVGRPFSDFLCEQDRPRFQEAFERLRRTGMLSDFEVEFRKADGSRLPLSITATAAYGADGEFLAGRILLTELGQRKQLEAELRRARDEALELARLKAGFLATMSHEIRTPLNGVLGMINLLLNTPLTPEQLEYARTVQTSSESLIDLINDILDFSKADADRLELDVLPFDLEQLIDHCFALVGAAAARKHLEVAYRIEPHCPIQWMGDGQRLRQVILNLLGNAVKFTESGEVLLEVAAGPEWLEVSVRDTGPGIPLELQERIFQPFLQADLSTTRKYGGTGLGLAISQRLVELMGGSMGVDSAPGQGARFHFRVPLQPCEEQPTAWVPPPRRVLVVDDHQTSRTILEQNLEFLGMQWRSFPDASRCLADPSLLEFDVAILDLHLKVHDGIYLAQELRRRGCTYPLLAWTSHGLGPDQRAWFEGVLRKPAGRRILCTALNHLDHPPVLQPPPFDAQLGETHPLDILVVDDVPTNLKVMSQSLLALGYSCECRESAAEALQALQQSNYNLLLLDLHMPGMDGFEAAQQVLQGFPNPPRIVAVTANALPGERDRCRQIGIDAILLKPFQVEELRAVLLSTPTDPTASFRRRLHALHADRDFQREILQSAQLDLQQFWEELQAARGHRAIREAAHRLKGVAGSVGATSLADVLKQAEENPEEISLVRVGQQVEQALRVIGQLLE